MTATLHAPAAAADRTAVTAILARFRRHHGLRVARTLERLPPRQRLTLRSLPLLYHRNHPALPGYAGPGVPCGIARYEPQPDAVAALRHVARSYADPRLEPPRPEIEALFLMGSGGSIGQGRASDVDLWVCCDSILHARLWPKVRLIDQWARDLGLELHTFLVDPAALRLRQRLPGCRTPALVLDEFYRSAALMAGRYPLWWLVNDTTADGYAAAAEALLRGPVVRPAEVVDFGPVPELPAGELAHAALTELDRALSTPHKSLLKLKLVEAYAEAPGHGVVSTEYRSRIHAGETDPLELDPYLLLYRHVERHLEERGRDNEIALVRRLLMAKTAENARSGNLADAVLGQLMSWGFTPAEIARFPRQHTWTMSRRVAEHRLLTTALDRGLGLARRLLATPPREAPADGSDGAARELDWLNRAALCRLELAVGRLHRRGSTAVPALHPALINRCDPVPATLERAGHGWRARDAEGIAAEFHRLVEAAVWGELNGARLRCAGEAPRVLRNLAQIQQALTGHTAGLQVFVDAEPEAPLWCRGGAGALPAGGDPLEHRVPERVLGSLDLLECSDDGRWQVETAPDRSTVVTALARTLAQPPETVAWHVIGGADRMVLAHRLERLHRHASRALAPPGAVFVLPFGGGWLTLQRARDDGGITIAQHPTRHALRAHLRRLRPRNLALDPDSPRLRRMRVPA